MGGGGGPVDDGPGSDDVVSDTRFKTLHNDPRFMNFPDATQKTKIDSRFKKMFTDKNFGTGGGVGNRDKRGRKTTKASLKNTGDDLKQYYDLEDEDESGGGTRKEEVVAEDSVTKKKSARDEKKNDVKKKTKKAPVEESDEDSESDDGVKKADGSDDDDKDAEHKLEASRDRMRGVNLSESDSESESGSDEDAESESEGVIPRMLAGSSTKQGSDDDETDQIPATSRIAIVDQEWQHLRAVDLLVVLRSFTPVAGEVRKVTVYPSDFGLKRMAEEATHGPLAAFGKTSDDMAAAAAKKNSKNSKKKMKGKTKKSKDVDDLSSDDSDFDDTDSDSESEDPNVARERMRQYERDRMTYYYAICECDSVDTAFAVYSACDGLEFERSACKLDLRYVPDGQDFGTREVRDESKSVPSDYDPPEFQVKALQQTNVKLSWDLDDPARKKAFSRKLTEDKLKDEDFAAYMASESDSDGELSDEEELEDEALGSNPGKGGSKTGKSEPKPKKASGKTDEADAEEKRAYLATLLGGDDDEDGNGGRSSETEEDDADDDEKKNSDDSDDENDAGFKRAAWGKGNAISAKNRFGDKSFSKKRVGANGDMEVTFHSGLEELSVRMKDRKDEIRNKKSGGKGETVWEKHLAEKSAKREGKAKEKKLHEKVRLDDVDMDTKNDGSGGGFEDDFFEGGDDEIDFDRDDDSGDEIGDATAKKSKNLNDGSDNVFKLNKKESKKDKKRRELSERNDPELLKEKADLELLMMDDDAVLLGFGGGKKNSGKNSTASVNTLDDDGRPLSKKKSRKARLAAKKMTRGKAARQIESDDEDDVGNVTGKKGSVAVDVGDARFAGLFDSHKFALDPTDPRYKETKSSGFIAEERARRRDGKTTNKNKGSADDDGEDALRMGKQSDASDGDDWKKTTKENASVAGSDQALRAMVSGLKRKSAAVANGSDGKRR